MRHKDEFGDEPEIDYYPGWLIVLIWLVAWVGSWGILYGLYLLMVALR